METIRSSSCIRLTALRSDIEGVAAIEFALLFPILLVLFVLTAEVVSALEQKRKIVQLARTLADLTAQGDRQSPMSANLMSDVLSASGPILAPFSMAAATMRISTVGVYQSKNSFGAYICSVYPDSGSRSIGPNSDIVIPLNFQHNGARFVLAEVSMPFQPVFGELTSRLIKGMRLNRTWSERMIWPVRSGTKFSGDFEVGLPGGAPCP